MIHMNFVTYSWESIVEQIFACVSCTPLGIPVVPDEHTINATSSSFFAISHSNVSWDVIFGLSINSLNENTPELVGLVPKTTIFLTKELFLAFATFVMRSIVIFDAKIILGFDRLMA